MSELYKISERLVRLCESTGITIATAESCTGGLIASSIVSIDGASRVFIEGCVTYSNEAKTTRLGVSEETLHEFGAVSEQTAREMAEGIIRTSCACASVATTGIAGPSGGTADKPVGLVWISVSTFGDTIAERYKFSGNRDEIREKTAVAALYMLYDIIVDRQTR